MQKRLSFILVVILVLTMGLSVTAYATGNEWVYDEPQVISTETEEYIKNLNENVFANYKNKPQLSFILINNLPANYPVDNYTIDMFNEYGVGTKEENCGMLFLLSINDREYSFQIGDGYESGTILRKDLTTDFVTSEMKSLLSDGNYDAVVMKITQHLEKIMADEENGIYAQKEAELIAKRQAQAEKAAAQKAAFIATMKKIGIGFCIACPLAGLIVLAYFLIKKYIRNQMIRDLINNNQKYITMAGTTPEKITEYIKLKCKNYSNDLIKEEFLGIIYGFYLGGQIKKADNAISLNRYLYKERLKAVNTYDAFINCRLTSLESIIYDVDSEEERKEEIKKANTAKVVKFLADNNHRIENPAIRTELIRNMKSYANSTTPVSDSDLEKFFVKEMESLNFKWEFEKFVDEHKEEIDSRFFNRNDFYREVTNTDQYRNYYYRRGYDRSWMRTLLFIHLANKRKAHQEKLAREERERQARIKREQEAARKRQLERMRSTNSSYGSSFRGGFSSGGGFKGKW